MIAKNIEEDIIDMRIFANKFNNKKEASVNDN